MLKSYQSISIKQSCSLIPHNGLMQPRIKKKVESYHIDLCSLIGYILSHLHMTALIKGPRLCGRTFLS